MSKTILIVDDSDSLRQVVNIALSGAGYTIIEACDGKDALSKLTGLKIHLIISDVNMPNMNGIEFVKQAKQIAQYKFTPVIMLTTENQQHMMEEGKKAGAKAWMVKPFKPAQMLQAVAKLLSM
ncbi:two-component system response regulator [Pseudoalteromonas citrea]|uniref:Two-component system response regulator n=1 Tax=Pseudoalteromonas citrea TaxID=43655 RepID=A0A5S3XLF3_9GAMM|nr:MULTISPECIES: response regulator [Pseudoalteromonas]RJE70763.1 two-component system response regulator [Pseudoalteromonas sp. MSK9-3]TMP41106.1 two-component system response regulator [Pseudoalteromonas citrea]TMP56273.1 two-component system response regulator [Pseudoalteromonas citrea]